MPLASFNPNSPEQALLLRILLDQKNQEPSITAQAFPEEQTRFLQNTGITAAFFLTMGKGKETIALYTTNEFTGELINTENESINLDLLIDGLQEGWLKVGNTEYNSRYQQISSYAGNAYHKRLPAVLATVIYAFLHLMKTDDFSDSNHDFLSASQVLSLLIICHSLGWLEIIAKCTLSSLADLFSNLGKFCQNAAEDNLSNTRSEPLLTNDGAGAVAVSTTEQQSSCLTKILRELAIVTFNIGIIAWPCLAIGEPHKHYGGELISKMSGDSDFAVVFQLIEALSYIMIMSDLLSIIKGQTPKNWKAFFGDIFNNNLVERARAGQTELTTYSSRIFQALPLANTQPAAELVDYTIPTAVQIESA